MNVSMYKSLHTKEDVGLNCQEKLTDLSIPNTSFTNPHEIMIPTDSVEEKLQRIATFSQGWSFGEGLPLRADAINAARMLNHLGKILNLTADVFPHEGGDVSIMFRAHTANQYLEIVCLPDDRYALTLEEGLAHPFTIVREQEAATLLDVINTLLSPPFCNMDYLWNSYDSSIQTNTVISMSDLLQDASKTLLTT